MHLITNKMNKDKIIKIINKHIKAYYINKKYSNRTTKGKYSQIIIELVYINEDLKKSKYYAKKNIEKRIDYFEKSLKYSNSRCSTSKKMSVIKELKYILNLF